MFKLKNWVTLSLSLTLLFSGSLLAEEKKGNILATINGKVITTEDFNRKIEHLPPQLRKRAEQNKLDFLQYQIRKELLFQEGIKQGIDKNPRVVSMIEQYQYELIVQKYLDKSLKDTEKISDKELKEYYQKNISSYKTKEEITASHILVKTEEEAKEILSELKKGKDFFELAKERSVDPGSNYKGGRLGPIVRGTMLPEFEKIAFDLKVGELSPIVKSEFGYHIIKLTDKTKPQKLDFAQVKDRIRQHLIHERTQKAISNLVDQLIKEAKIVINEEKLR